MLTTQYNGASGFGASGFGASYNPADVIALQNALLRSGKSVRTDGVMDGRTLAATYELLRDKGGVTASSVASLISTSAGSSIKNAFTALQTLDKKLASTPLVSFSFPDLLRDATLLSQIGSVVQTACGYVNAPGCSTAKDIYANFQSVYNTVMSTMSSASGTLAKIIYVLVPGSAPAGVKAIDLTTLIQPIKTAVTAITTTTTPPATGQQTYPAGTVYAFSPKIHKYRIAIPRAYGGGLGIAQSGLFGDCVFGDCGLGAAASMTEVAPADAAPAGGRPVTETDLEKLTGQLPFYKKWQFWAAIGGGVAVVGTGTALLMRRKRSA